VSQDDSLKASHSPDDSDSDLVFGAQRLNRLPLVILSVVSAIILVVLIFAVYQRSEQGRASGGVGILMETKPVPVEPEDAVEKLWWRPDDDVANPESNPESIALDPEPISPPSYVVHDDFDGGSDEFERDARLSGTVINSDDLYDKINIDTDTDTDTDTDMAGGLPKNLLQKLLSDGKDQDDPNLRNRKELFRQTDIHYGYSLEPRRPAPSPFILRVGSIIPAVLVSGLNSDSPGEIIASVSHDVRDSRTGRYVLIPHGTQLVGTYDHHVARGQTRIMTAWHRLNFPDGSTVNIGGMVGTDQAGFSGLEDKVDNHYWRVFGNATLLAFIGAGVQIAVPDEEVDQTTSGLDPSVTATLKMETARQWGELGSEVVRRNLNIQPTISVRPGYRFNVMVDKDLLISPYAE